MNYLDNFLFVAMLRAMCDTQTRTFLEVCRTINFPVSMEKTFWSDTKMVFLGFLIDTIHQLVMVPVEKIKKGKDIINKILQNPKKKVMVCNLQKVCRFLNFLGRCIVPGRVFRRRLYSHMSNNKLRPHHHIRVNLEMRCDLETWRIFLQHPSTFVRGFIDMIQYHLAHQIEMASDASKGRELGSRAICGNSWMFAQCPELFIETADSSIAFLELYALTIGVKPWIHRFRNKRIILLCDNQSVVQMVNNTTSSCKHCMVLIRIVVLESLFNNVHIFARYVHSQDNTAPDYLSRLKIDRFKALKNDWETEPTPLPDKLWPINKCWKIKYQYVWSCFAERRRTGATGTGNSDASSRISEISMQHILDKLQFNLNKESTAKNYLGIWRNLNRFLIQLDHVPKEWEDRVSFFCTHLIHDRKLQSSTLKPYISAIKHTLKCDNYKWKDEK